MTLLLFALLAAAPQATVYPRAAVVLVRVIDGDTVRLDLRDASGAWRRNQRARLARIDAPELHTPAGPAARAALATFLAGKALGVTVLGREYYGRLLIELDAGGRNASDFMLWTGHAGPYVRKRSTNKEGVTRCRKCTK